MSGQVLVSVIVPVYNGENHLPLTVDSIRKQTYESWELLLVDDGSADGSLALCREYEQQDPRIRVVAKENGGVCSARNAGLALASGKYVMFTDADDRLEPGLLEDCVARMEKTGADLTVFGMVFDIEKGGSLIRSLPKTAAERVFSLAELDSHYEDLYQNNYLTSACNKLFRREIIIKHGLSFDERITNYEDLLFSLRYLALCETVAVCQKIYYHYILRETPGMSRKYKARLTAMLPIIITELVQAVEALPMGQERKHRAKENLQYVLWVGLSNICKSGKSLWLLRNEIRSLCSEGWVREALPLGATGNINNDICVTLLKGRCWLLLALWNKLANWLRATRDR